VPSLTSAAVITAVALIVPLAIHASRLPVPEIVVQIVAGIVVGPQVLGWARVDAPVQTLSVIGLALLLLLAGLEIDFTRLRGQVLTRTLLGFAVSFGVALVVGFGLSAGGFVRSPLLIAVTLSATSLGIILPILTDARQADTAFGQVIVAGASVAEIAPVVLLSVLFSARAGGTVSPVVLLVAFLVFVAAVGAAVAGVERSGRLTRTLLALQETTAEIRVRGALALLMLFATLATRFGLEAILGAFLAGATLKILDRDETATHALLKVKLRAIGFGVFVPFFFVSTGMSLDVRALVEHPATLARIPVFLVALLVVRAVPALLYRPFARRRRHLLAAGLLQATSLSIPVVAGSIGVGLGLLSASNFAALVAAGLLSVLTFPLVALKLLAEDPEPRSLGTTRAGSPGTRRGEDDVEGDPAPGFLARVAAARCRRPGRLLLKVLDQ
jgi:Kef-type K+ transport system membrane component KefB